MNVDQRVNEFLHESNAIEDITNIDYSKAENRQPQRGHYGALQEVLRIARAHRPLTVQEICRWQKMITSEQLDYSHEIPVEAVGQLRSPQLPINVRVGDHLAPSFQEVPGLMDALVKDLNKALLLLQSFPNIVQVVTLLGNFFQRFEAIHPFVDGNGRTGRLLLSYIATWCKIPLIVVRVTDRPEFYPAHRSKTAMRLFMGKKIQEVIADREGRLIPMVKHYGLSARYHDPAVPGEVVVEWHELVQAMDEWSAYLSTK